MNSDLATIHSTGENNFVAALYTANNDKNARWIGYRRGTSGFESQDGTDMDYSNFARGEPNNKDGSENCSAQGFNGTDAFLWADYKCTNRKRFVCHKRCVTVNRRRRRGHVAGSRPGALLFPLDRTWRFRADIVDDPIDSGH